MMLKKLLLMLLLVLKKLLRKLVPRTLRKRTNEELSTKTAGYHFYCNKCGHSTSFKTKEGYRTFKHSCTFALVKDEATGLHYRVRSALAAVFNQLPARDTRQLRRFHERKLAKHYRAGIRQYLKGVSA